MKNTNRFVFFGLALLSIFGLSACSGEGPAGPQGEQGLPGKPGQDGEDGRSIVAIELLDSDGLVDTYVISYSDGTTSTFIVTNGAQGEQGIQGLPGEDGHSPVVSIDPNGYWVIDGVTTNICAKGEDGEKGADGTSCRTGNGTPDSGLGISGDSYIDLDTWDYYVKVSGQWVKSGNLKGGQGPQGDKGDQGPQGEKGDKGEQGVPGEDGSAVLTGKGKPVGTTGKNGDSYIDLSTWDYYVKKDGLWVREGNIKGDGQDGEDGVSIVSIKLTSSKENIDTYTIEYSDGSKTTFTVTNGVDGEQGIQGQPGKDGHTPVITISEDGYWVIDGERTGTLAQGDKGEQGDEGLSAYEIYIKHHPEYTGTEQEWIEDLVNGDLRETYTVTFNTTGGSKVESQEVKYGRLVTRPADEPTRTGYLFDGWYMNGEPFPFNSYQVYDDLTIQARWKANNLTVTFDPNGGTVEYNTKVITYGVSYVLPTPERANYVFDGWYLDETVLCPQSGTWDFAKSDITLVARWAGTVADITLAGDENVSIKEPNVQLSYGSDYQLPVPTITSGDSFQGWAGPDGNLVTDETGASLSPSAFTGPATLTAVYYVPVRTPNELLKLCSLTAGDKNLSLTYSIQNDLDFTGLENERIENFEGRLLGNGYKIIGLENPLFGSVGRQVVNASSDIVIQDIEFDDFSASSFIENVYKCSSLVVSGLTINSFVRDDMSYCGTYGVVRNVGLENYLAYGPDDMTMRDCHILDEWATIESGLIQAFESGRSLSVESCSVRANTKQSAFLSETSHNFERYEKVYFEMGYADSNEYDDVKEHINFVRCSNSGLTGGLICAALGELRYHGHFGGSYYRYLDVTECINTGNSSGPLYVSTLRSNFAFGNSSYSVRLVGSYKVISSLNFGSSPSIFAAMDWKDSYLSTDNSFSIESCFNAGEVSSASFSMTTEINNNYQFVPIAGIEDQGASSINNYAQVNADFFRNTIGLDDEVWDLSYINLQDEYGLPKIFY